MLISLEDNRCSLTCKCRSCSATYSLHAHNLLVVTVSANGMNNLILFKTSALWQSLLINLELYKSMWSECLTITGVLLDLVLESRFALKSSSRLQWQIALYRSKKMILVFGSGDFWTSTRWLTVNCQPFRWCFPLSSYAMTHHLWPWIYPLTSY